MVLNKKMLYMICMSVLSILFLYGCSMENGLTKEPEYTSNTEEYDLAANEWKEFRQVEEADTKFVVVDYLEDFCSIPESGMTRGEGFSATEQDTYYRIQRYNAVDGVPLNYVYYLFSVNTATLEKSTVKLDFHGSDEWKDEGENEWKDLAGEVEKGNAFVTALDAAQGKLCVFMTVWDPENRKLMHHYAIRTDREGNIEKLLDLLPVIRENIDLHQMETLNVGMACDSEYYYVIDRDSPQILVIDGDGKKQGTVMLEDFSQGIISVTCKSPTGIPVFEYKSSNNLTVVFSLNGMEKKILYTGQKEKAAVRNIDAFGNILFLENRKLLWWDAAQGSCRYVYDASGLSDCVAILHNTAEEVVLVSDNRGIPCLYILSINTGDDSEEVQKDIVLLQAFYDQYTEICAAEYSRTHPGVTITVKVAEGVDSSFWNRTVEEMKARKGPDMLVINRQQMMELEQAGVLADLNGVLPKEVQDQIFHGALQYGILHGNLYGITYEASIGTLLVSDVTWEKKNWTLQEFMELIRQREAGNRTPGRIESLSHNVDAYQLLYDFFLRNMGESTFVDLQRQTCNFETEEFYALLRFCKQYGESGSTGYLNQDEQVREVKEGEALTFALNGNFLQYSRGRAMFGEDYHCVGFPTEQESGSLVECYHCVSVSSWTKHSEAIQDFLQYLMSEQNQANYTTDWVRRDVILNRVQEHIEISEKPVFLMDGKGYIQLEGREDGSSYAEEYIVLMDASPLFCTEYEIQNIILEEVEAYFAGDKTEQKTAEVIQNRVQLYLDEHN